MSWRNLDASGDSLSLSTHRSASETTSGRVKEAGARGRCYAVAWVTALTAAFRLGR
jgi:hypothetical protein